jgi:DSF synthase
MTAAMLSLELDRYENLNTYRDVDGEVQYFAMDVRPRPCFTWGVMRDILAFQQRFTANPAGARCLVLASDNPNFFSLGGDLSLFQTLIEKNDRETLAQYAADCVDALHNHLTLSVPGIVTVSLLEGDTLGAGFETALSSDVVIAERGVRLGFPEVLFNLVPGHGAFYLLARRIGPRAAEALIHNGQVHTAEELHAQGLIDILVDKGQGRQAVRDLLDSNRKTWNAYCALQHIKRHHQPVTREALSASAAIWVDAAMRLTSRNLRMMERLVNAQQKRINTTAPKVPVQVAPVAAPARLFPVAVNA